jgi:uncharacterized metal-binding protein YceD (DUF177 family)
MTDFPPMPWSHPLRVSELATRKPTRFDIAPDPEIRAEIARWAGIDALEDLRLKGALSPAGRSDWLLEAAFSARVVQPCAITLAPVHSDLSETVTRRYLAEMPVPEGDEIEMPEDDSAEQLGAVIDLGALALEVLELALPLQPRAPGAELGTVRVAEKGVTPLRDEDTRPFAGLADLLKGDKPGPDKGET